MLICVSGIAIADSGYQKPPKLMADLVDAPRRPGAVISPNKTWVALLLRPGAPSISELAQPEEKLAGLKINSAIFAPSRSRGYVGITLKKLQGDGETLLGDLPKGTFRKQLVDSADAAVKVLVDKGVADPEKIAIAGHSYGAFMVANLLAHSELFKAGIARSGAYNRTLTPFGFQGEERSFWEGQKSIPTCRHFFTQKKLTSRC